MTKLEKIEQDIVTLSRADLWKLADWFAEYQAEQWDRQIEEDAKAGRLDALAQAARVEMKTGKCKPL